MSPRSVSRAALYATFMFSSVAYGAEISVLSANGMREVMQDLGPKFEGETGHKLKITFGTLGVIVKRVQDGENPDVIIIPQEGIERLIKDGRASSDELRIIARSGVGLIIRKGAPKGDISTATALRNTLLSSKFITYLDPASGGATGLHFANVLDRLGIADAMKPKTLLHQNAPEAGALVASGQADIGVNLIQELMPLSGVEILGPLPGDLQLTLVFGAALTKEAKERSASKALIDSLVTPQAAAVIRQKGLEPAS